MTQQVTRIDESLPVFLIEREGAYRLYAPGESVLLDAEEARGITARPGSSGDLWLQLGEQAGKIRTRAERAQLAWQEQKDEAFAPECLTIYLSNRCDLACTYCFAAEAVRTPQGLVALRTKTGAESPIISLHQVEKAAEFVARHCAAKGKPLTVVFHGGGEPTLHWDLLVQLVELTRGIAARQQVPWQSYLATHGAISRDKAEWLARNISLIGLSCDGPPEIQNAQRSDAGGHATSAKVEQFAQLLRDSQTNFVLRATITKEIVCRQADIVSYFCSVLGGPGQQIRFEPAYTPYFWGENVFGPEDAASFVQHYLDAAEVAVANGCRLDISGSRLDEIHGPYCNVLRQVLHLTPDGTATACFLSTNGSRGDQQQMVIGRVDPVTQEFTCDKARLQQIRRRALTIPSRCESCVNIYHCTRDCPDVCPVVGGEDNPNNTGGFRCRVLKLLSEYRIWSSHDAGYEPSVLT